MVEDLEDMPAGTLGFRISGRITRDEYFQMLDPVRELLERGQKVSFLVVTESDFDGLDLPALWEDVKAAGSWVSSIVRPGIDSRWSPTRTRDQRVRMAESRGAARLRPS